MAYSDDGIAGSALGGNTKQQLQPRDKKPAEEVLMTAERLNNRLSGMLASLRDLRERVSGVAPEPPCASDAATAFTLGGFVGSTGQAIERSHSLLTDCDTELGRIVGVI